MITSWLPQQVNPHSILVDRAGNVYVGSRDGIAKYTPTGGYITQWGELPAPATESSPISSPSPVVAPWGTRSRRIPGGTFTQATPTESRSSRPTGASSASSGSAPEPRVICGERPRGKRLRRRPVGGSTSSPRPVATSRDSVAPSGGIRFPHGPGGIAADAAGNIYITERDFVVEKFGPRPGKPRARTCRKPAARTRARRACFRFHSKQAGVRFQCRLTGRSVPKRLRRFRACTSPKRYRGLKPGRKAFLVRAIRSGVVGKPNQRRCRGHTMKGRA